MKNKWNSISRREQILVVFMVFAVFAGGFYLLITNLSEKRLDLQATHSELTVEKEDAERKISQISRMQGTHEDNLADLAVRYKDVHDNFDSPLVFERMFLSWLNGKELHIESFSASDAALNTITEQSEEPEMLTEMETNVSILNGEEVEAPAKEKKDADDTKKTKKKDAVTHEILSKRYEYVITMTDDDYVNVIDNINNLSRYFKLHDTNFVYEEGTLGKATFNITAYIYDKPEQFKDEDNLNYFKYCVVNPVKEVDEDGNPILTTNNCTHYDITNK